MRTQNQCLINCSQSFCLYPMHESPCRGRHGLVSERRVGRSGQTLVSNLSDPNQTTAPTCPFADKDGKKCSCPRGILKFRSKRTSGNSRCRHPKILVVYFPRKRGLSAFPAAGDRHSAILAASCPPQGLRKSSSSLADGWFSWVR